MEKEPQYKSEKGRTEKLGVEYEEFHGLGRVTRLSEIEKKT